MRNGLRIAGLVALLAAGLTGVKVLSTEEKQPSEHSSRNGDWTSLVGWYELEEGRQGLLTWAADADLRLAGLGEPHSSERFDSREDGSFLWTAASGEQPRVVRFQRDASGRAVGFEWDSRPVGSGTARRIADEPYSLRELEFQNEGIWLSGTLLLPKAAGPLPTVAMIHGSGESDRDNLWYLTIADRIARGGVAVLLPDKRGCGRSSGDWTTASMEDFAKDTRAAVRALRRLAELDPERVGLLGCSQGGSVAPLAASITADIGFVISLSGGVATFDELLLHESRQTLREEGLPGLLADGLAPAAAAMAKLQRPLWWKKNGSFDPLPYWTRLSVPALVVYGTEDEGDNVPVSQSVARLEGAGPAKLTLKLYSDSGHGLFLPGTRTVRPDLLDLLATWIRASSTPGITR